MKIHLTDNEAGFDAFLASKNATKTELSRRGNCVTLSVEGIQQKDAKDYCVAHPEASWEPDSPAQQQTKGGKTIREQARELLARSKKKDK